MHVAAHEREHSLHDVAGFPLSPTKLFVAPRRREASNAGAAHATWHASTRRPQLGLRARCVSLMLSQRTRTLFYSPHSFFK